MSSVPGHADWETVASLGRPDRTERMRVPGGWLYRTVLKSDVDTYSVALSYVPHAFDFPLADEGRMD